MNGNDGGRHGGLESAEVDGKNIDVCMMRSQS